MDYECPQCLTVFKRYWSTQTVCGRCYYGRVKSKATKPRSPIQRSTKPIRQRGKVANKDRAFIDKVVRPYLDKNFGIQCAECGAMPPRLETGEYSRHAPDHIKGKGPHPELRYVITNFQYLCVPCHEKKTGAVQWSSKAAA